MELLESILNLTESERQKINETLQHLRNNSTSVISKQKTLDNWIVKSKSPSSNSIKKVTNQKETVSISETGESSRNCDHEEVSSTLQNTQLPSNSVTPLGKSNNPESEINTNVKQLRILLNRQDCLDSNQKSPEPNKLSSENNSTNPTEIKSPSKKKIPSEIHSPLAACSYNLRSSRGVSEEKSSIESANSLFSISECEETDKIDKSVTKHKPKVKNCVEKDASPNSCTNFEGVNCNQKTGNTQNFECKTSTAVIQSELEHTTNIISVDSNKVITTDENPTPTELDATVVVKGKRKRTIKSKKSKLLNVSNTAQGISSIQENGTPEEFNVNIKSTRSASSKKATKLNSVSTNPSESPVEKTVQFNATVIDSSPIQKQMSSNDIFKLGSKLKVRQTIKSKDMNELVSQEKTKPDLGLKIKVKKKKFCDLKINSGFRNNVDVEWEVPNKQLESVKNSKSQNNEHIKETEEMLTKDKNTINLDSKRTTRNMSSENKHITAARNNLLPDSGLVSTDDQGTSTTSIEKSSKISPFENKEFAKETKELLIKDTNSVNSKRIYRKKGNENKSLPTTKSNLILDPDLTSKKNDRDDIISTEMASIDSAKNSPSQSKECVKETEELLIKDTKSVNSKRINRKKCSENKSLAATKKNLLLDSDLTSKNNDRDSIISTEISSIDASKNSPTHKECSEVTEKLLIKDTNTVISVNIDTKRRCRKRGSENKPKVTTKKSLLPDSEKGSLDNNKDSIISIGISTQDSLSSTTKDISTKQTSSNDNSSATEIININQNKCSQSIIIQEDISHNELNSINEFKEPPQDQSQKSKVISPKDSRSNGNIVLDSKKCSKVSSVPKKGNALKRKTSVQSPASSKKKSKVAEDEKQLNTSLSISDDLSTEILNSGLILKKCGTKKKATSSKQKAATNSDEDQLDILITKSKANSLNSNVVQEPKDQLLKKLKSNTAFVHSQKVKTRVKNSKKKINTLKSEAVSDNNLSKNDEMEKLNCNLFEESYVKNKVCKTVIRKALKNTPIKSNNKGKSIRKTDLNSSSEKLSDHSTEVQMESDFSLSVTDEPSNIQMESDSSHFSLEKSSVVDMELDSTTRKSKACDSNTNSEDIVVSEIAQETIPVTSMDVLANTSENGKEKHTAYIERNTKITDDLIISNSNNIDFAQTNFKSSVEFDEKMQHNYEAFCKVKEMLEVIGMSIEELFENQEMIDSLKCVRPDGVYFITKCKSDSNISVYIHDSKKELKNILNKLKKEYSDENK